MRHMIDADDVENEISEEARKIGGGETPTELKREVENVQREPTQNRHMPTTDRPYMSLRGLTG
jgi:hypothetical protein